MNDSTSPSINDLVRVHAYRSYEESEGYPDDIERATRFVRISEAPHSARKVLELGFERGYTSRDEHFTNLDNAYGELLSNFSANNSLVLVYSQMIARIQHRLGEQDAIDRVPMHILADLDQIITEGTLELTAGEFA